MSLRRRARETENQNENKCIVHICLGSSIGEVEQVAYLRLSRSLANYINEVIQNSRLEVIVDSLVFWKYFKSAKKITITMLGDFKRLEGICAVLC